MIRETSRIKLQITPETYFDLPDFLFSSSQNLESCKYLFPNEDIYIANLNPSFISTLFKSYTYLLYLYSTKSMKFLSISFISCGATFGIAFS